MYRELLKQTIIAAKYLTKEQTKELDFYQSNICLELSNGMKIIPVDSHSLNDTGVFFTSSEDVHIFPSITGKMLEDEVAMEKWNEKVRNFFMNKKIMSIRTLRKSELKDLDWHHRSVVLFFEDNSYAYVSKDDEGNEGGEIYIF